MTEKYCIGVDFGTLSARALLAAVSDGREVAAAEFKYPHGVMSERLPDGRALPPDWALQHPRDYTDALKYTVREVMHEAGVPASDVVGMSVDFTACTLLCIDKDGCPLCLTDKFAHEPHAYVKLWKHHAAQYLADRLNEAARTRGEKFLEYFGGKISSESMLPKIWQVLLESPEVYEAAYSFIEAGDWITMLLTGKDARSSCAAGYKALWSKRAGYPAKAFLRALDPRLENLAADKLSDNIYPAGSRAGELTLEAADWLGLKAGMAVAVANVDAHVSLPPAGITDKGKMLIIMGTSACYVMLDDVLKPVPGISGAVEDGVIAGLVGYEAGQSCVGDGLNWFIDNCVPAACRAEAGQRGSELHTLLSAKAARLKPGESGLMALDWWNGNRSVLSDAELSGLIMGLTLGTRPEEIYRALIEATAYGARMIIDAFNESGVKVNELYACGGIAHKNPLMMQIYADVLGYDIKIARSTQTPALGAAMFGAVAAGAARGGYDSIEAAAQHMGGVNDSVYRPAPQNHSVYDRLYGEYKLLHDYFGRGGNAVMKILRAIKHEQSLQK